MNHLGKLLIANPKMDPSNPFFKTVIYIYQDNHHGTVGCVLNRASQHTVEEVCNDKGIGYSGSNRNMYHGGPMGPTSLVLLHSDEWYSGNTVYAGVGYSVSSDDQMLEKLSIGDYPGYWRLFVGMSVWKPGQLYKELEGSFPYTEQNKWLTVDAKDEVIFNYDGEKQWEEALNLVGQQMFDKYF